MKEKKKSRFAADGKIGYCTLITQVKPLKKNHPKEVGTFHFRTFS